MFPPRKTQKIIAGPLNGCGILQICLRPLEYLIRFPTKLLVKLYFGNVWMFLKFYLLFKIFAPQKPPKKSLLVFEKSVASDKFTFTVWNTSFWQNCYLSLFCHICEYCLGNVQFLRCFHPKKTPKTYHRFL